MAGVKVHGHLRKNKLGVPRPVRRHLRYVLAPRPWIFTDPPRPTWMTPDEFVRASLEQIHPPPIPERFVIQEARRFQQDRLRYDPLVKKMLDSVPLDPLMVEQTPEGRTVFADGMHRAVAAKRLGIKKVPVLVFSPQDPNFIRTPFEAELRGTP